MPPALGKGAGKAASGSGIGSVLRRWTAREQRVADVLSRLAKQAGRRVEADDSREGAAPTRPYFGICKPGDDSHSLM
jgi:hypothetical protein